MGTGCETRVGVFLSPFFEFFTISCSLIVFSLSPSLSGLTATEAMMVVIAVLIVFAALMILAIALYAREGDEGYTIL